MYVDGKKVDIVDVATGIQRKTLAYGEGLLVTKVSIEKGVVAALHSHTHEQVTYILEGEFEFIVGDEKFHCFVGDSVYISSKIEHGVICLQKGSLLDVFSPCREEFVPK